MKLTSKRFSLEDFPEEHRAWLGALLSSLNQQSTELVSGLANQITMDNLYQEIIELNFINDASNLPLSIKTKFNKQPRGVIVIAARDEQGSQPTSQPWVQWTFANQLLRITSISNLTASTKYSINLQIIYG